MYWCRHVGLTTVSCGHTDPSFPNPGPSQSDIKVLTATTFLFHGQKCQLLGVVESDDPQIREEALQFTTMWFKKIGNYIGVYNANSPLRLKDGTCVVWIRGYDMFLSCLNVELVRAGLVNVDYKSWDGYSFTEPTKEGEAIANWRGDLDEAMKSHERGDKPKVLFEWPTKDDAAVPN